jgi:hypothetical protein
MKKYVQENDLAAILLDDTPDSQRFINLYTGECQIFENPNEDPKEEGFTRVSDITSQMWCAIVQNLIKKIKN